MNPTESSHTVRRTFTRAQKRALYEYADGRCENCGVPLPDGWHADHISPFCAGGITDVINGQALCPRCNLLKASKTMAKDWPIEIVLRQWQQEFLNKYVAKSASDFMLVATPGAGKTTAALRVAHILLRQGTVRQLVIVCPTDNLRSQWLKNAALIGLELEELQVGTFSGQIVRSPGYTGIVTTYQQAVSRKDLLRKYTSTQPTLVILDEIHHCGENENLSWGPVIKDAFEIATRRLSLSGTPFRSDNNKIPFLEYNLISSKPTLWECVPDFTYGYGDALRDSSVVRHIVFPSWDGKIVWENMFGDEREVTFQDDLNSQEGSRRLRMALDSRGQAIYKVIKLANAKLDQIRAEGHQNAGGLIVATDQQHAYALADIIEQLSGEPCIIAVSEDKEASIKIDKFRNSKSKWIVAVKMVSEGVDIKRLRVGVYATNIITRVFFHQVIGRVIRYDNKWDNLDDQTAWFYVPEDPRLEQLIREIRQQLYDYVREEEETERTKKSSQTESSAQSQTSFTNNYEFKYSDADERHHHFNEHKIPIDEVMRAEEFFAQYAPGFERIPGAIKANFLRNMQQIGQSSAGQSAGNAVIDPPISTVASAHELNIKPAFEQKKDLQSEIKRKVGRLVILCQQKGITLPGPNAHRAIHNAWGRQHDYSQTSSNKQLDLKLKWLQGLIDRAIQGDKSIQSELRG